MCWAYVTAKSCSSALKVSVNPYLILFLGALPDIDLLLAGYGVQHRTITHSLVFWLVVFVPIFIKYRKRGIPYFVALAQHIVFGDYIVNYTRPLWPISSLKFGMSLQLVALENISLEIIGLILFLIWFNFNGDSRLTFGKIKSNLLSVFPLLPLFAFFFFIAQNMDISLLLAHEPTIDLPGKVETKILLSDFLPIIVIGHLILASVLLVSLMQGSRAILHRSAL